MGVVTIDGFFPILEMYGELIEGLEAEVVTSPSPQTLERIYIQRCLDRDDVGLM